MGRPGETLEELQRVIVSRRDAAENRSYTARLLAAGPRKVGGKVVEEAGELAMAAVAEPDDRVVAECADLLYHTLVLLASRGLGLEAVEGELQRRFGTSGLEEKAARGAHAPENAP